MTTTPWQEHRPPARSWTLPELRGLWRFREVVLLLAQRDLRLRYKQTVVGIGWVVVQPLAAAAAFTLVFGELADIESDGLPYPVFVGAGVVVWTYVSTSLTAAARSLADHRDLVTKVALPRIVAPVAALLPALFDLAVWLVLLAIALAVWGVFGGAAALLTPIWILAAVAVAAGSGLWVAALNAQYRDVRQLLTYVTQLWMFLSPVVFPSSLVDGAARWLFAVNPMAGLIDGFRWSVLGAPAPPIEDLASLASGTLLIVTGLLYFGRVERRIVDVI